MRKPLDARTVIHVAVLLPSIGLAIGPTFGPPHISDSVYVFDTEGRCGAIRTSCLPSPPDGNPSAYTAVIGGEVELYLASDLDTPLTFDCGLNIGATTNATGSPYYVRRFHPDFGCLSTFGYVGAMYGDSYPSYVLPIPFSEYNIPIRSRLIGEIGPSGHAGMLLIRDPFISDDPTSFSLAVDIKNFFIEAPGAPPIPSILVEYLPGNTREGSHAWVPTQFYSGYTILWSDPTLADQYPDHLQLGLPAPVGPIRISMHFDGYTTDTIELDFEDLKAYWWTPVVGPDGGLTPSGFTPLAGILDQSISDGLLGACEPCATLAGAQDPNGDSVTDAADFIFPDPES